MTVPNAEVRDAAAALLSHPLHFPEEFKSWMQDFVAQNIPLIPFSNIFGARVNIARSGDYIATSETASDSVNYSDCPTVGPQLLNLADGKYLFAYGCKSRGSMSPSFNGSTPSDDDMVSANESNPNGGRMIMKTLSNDNNNSVVLKYKTNRAFQDRWLVAIRVGAPGE